MESSPLSALEQRLISHLQVLYPQTDAGELARQCLSALKLDAKTPTPQPHRNIWDQRDIMLITYGDTLRWDDHPPLETLHGFVKTRLSDAISVVHLLPFFPYSSDDGFSVMDYTTVNPSVGRWRHVSALAQDFKVMGDLVINHCSSRSRWFENFKKQNEALILKGLVQFNLNDLDGAKETFIHAKAVPEIEKSASQWLGYIEGEQKRRNYMASGA